MLCEDIRENKVRHLEKVKKRACESKNPRQYFAALNLLKEKEPVEKWSPCQLFPDDNEKEVAEKCADFFNKISNEFVQIETPVAPVNRISPPETYQIAGRLRTMRKPRSLVPGDIDREVVTKCADLLAIPLHKIFAKVFETCEWPGGWKEETVVIIPKNQAPDGLGETRNLSCTPLFSKMLEAFILEELRKHVKMKPTQFGGIKGLSVNHFLMETWDEVLHATDAPGRAVNLMSIDFQKVFNRMDHGTCLERLRAKGAPEHLVQLVGAFLHKRTMSVKIGETRSDPRIVNGGAPQGSIFGPFLFCVVSEILSEMAEETLGNPRTRTVNRVSDAPLVPNVDVLESSSEGDLTSSSAEWADVDREFNFFRPRRRNPLDDTQLSERLTADEIAANLSLDDVDQAPTVKSYIDDFNIIEPLDTGRSTAHVTARKTMTKIHAQRCEEAFEDITEKATEINMIVNAKKTQMLCINPNPSCKMTSYIRPNNGEIVSCDNLKILAFVFYSRPGCHAQIDNLLQKFRAQLWYLRKLAAGGLAREDLLQFYTTCMRPVLEYTNVTYHSMLSNKQAGCLERAQARALKVVFGAEKSYRMLLGESKIEKLEDRRRKAFEKFTLKARNNKIVSKKWFPLREENNYNIRGKAIYLEERAHTERLRLSPIFQMRKHLNTVT